MRKKNNVLSAVMVLMICGLSGFAQNNNTTSPFSRYGLGDLNPYGYGRSSAMGGASLGSRHAVQINSANPASYTANDSLSFIFDFGVDGTFSNYKSNTGTQKNNDINFRYFSLSCPITKWMGAAMGIQPYSDMGYEVSSTESFSSTVNISKNYKGEGSTSKAYLGAAISPVKGLSVGANVNYIFGRISRNTSIVFSDPTYFGYFETEGTRLRDFTFTYGLQYDYSIKKDEFLTLGVTFEKEANLDVMYSLSSYRANSYGIIYVDSIPESKNRIKLPSNFGVGFSYNKLNKLEISADYYYAVWSKATLLGNQGELLTDQHRISAGVEYIPDAASIRSYYKRVKYRAGIHQEGSYLKLNDHQINEYGLSLGLGLPFPKSKSTANFAIEVGKRGTTDYDLVKNNYTKVSLYLNFYDYWFYKRKFD